MVGVETSADRCVFPKNFYKIEQNPLDAIADITAVISDAGMFHFPIPAPKSPAPVDPGLCRNCARVRPHKGKTWCSECLRSARRTVAARDAARERLRFRRRGICKEEYNALLEGQNPQCTICGRAKVPEGRRPARVFVDYARNGRTRGHVCNRCTVGLTMFLDSPDVLQTAAAYLEAA